MMVAITKFKKNLKQMITVKDTMTYMIQGSMSTKKRSSIQSGIQIFQYMKITNFKKIKIYPRKMEDQSVSIVTGLVTFLKTVFTILLPKNIEDADSNIKIREETSQGQMRFSLKLKRIQKRIYRTS